MEKPSNRFVSNRSQGNQVSKPARSESDEILERLSSSERPRNIQDAREAISTYLNIGEMLNNKVKTEATKRFRSGNLDMVIGECKTIGMKKLLLEELMQALQSIDHNERTPAALQASQFRAQHHFALVQKALYLKVVGAPVLDVCALIFDIRQLVTDHQAAGNGDDRRKQFDVVHGKLSHNKKQTLGAMEDTRIASCPGIGQCRPCSIYVNGTRAAVPSVANFFTSMASEPKRAPCHSAS
jgi:hypothetical protein